MKRALTILGVVLVTLATTDRPAVAQNGQVGPQEIMVPYQTDPPAVPGALREVYRRFAAYWEDGNARAIARLAKDARVHVVVQRKGIGARLSPSQLQYLLEELFDETQEVDFRFPAYVTYDPGSGSGYAVGERVYRDGPGHEIHVDRVFLAARSERGHFVLNELRLTVD